MEQHHQEAGKEKQSKPSERNYLSLGISLGICFGVVLGQWGLDNLATGIAVGMCLGVGIGVYFKNKKKV